MKRLPLVLAAMASVLASASTGATVTGFGQLRQVQRLHDVDCATLPGCATMAQEAQAELLIEQRASDTLSASLRAEGLYDRALESGRVRVREAFIDWAPGGSVNLKLGRQVLTWGVSDYLYVNDIFPKNYDSFFTGGGFDRMKEPVDAARLTWNTGGIDVEAIISRSKSDRSPDPRRFVAMAMSGPAGEAGDADDRTDVALKVSGHAGGWDLAGYTASFGSREPRFFMDAGGLRFDRSRLRHLGASITGNAAGGLVWLEGALRDASAPRTAVVSRHSIDEAAKFIAGYSREVGTDLTASVQLQLEAMTNRDRYLASLAPGLRPVKRIGTTLHLRVQGRWINQTVGAGAQLFVGNEGDTHFNPFASWSPADGWTFEGGANLFNGKPDTRYGAFKDDSNVYVLGRFSF